MGMGKTSAMINYMNQHGPSKRFIFVTPFLDEGQRVVDACPSLNFQTPESYDDPEHPNGDPRSKLVDFKQFLRAKKNIVTTHALFERFDSETTQLIINGNYTLVMDEVAQVAEKHNISPKDARTILNVFTDQDELGKITWKETEYDYWGNFDKAKRLCENGNLWKYRDTVIIKMIPINAFRAFDDVFIMTYLFEAQLHCAYFKLFDVQYEYVYVEGDSVDTYHITEEPRLYTLHGLKDLIHIYDDRKMNLIGEDNDRYDLSVGWYDKNTKTSLVKALQNNVYTYFRHRMNATADQVLWTCFKKRDKPGEETEDRDPYFTPRSFSSGFLSCNARATNAYRNRTILAYPINRFLAPEIKNFFADRGIHIDIDRWALSEMIQWIWRSAIRDGKDIWIYIPSKRMRTLLEDWIDEISTGVVGGAVGTTASPNHHAARYEETPAAKEITYEKQAVNM